MGLTAKERRDWEERNKTARKIDYHGSITERGLEIIKNAEGPKKHDTNLYGITQIGLDGLQKLTTKYDVYVPEKFVNADAMKLSEEDCREAAGYIAMLNERLVDTFTGTDYFSKLPLETKSGFLTYLHNEGPYQLRKSMWKNLPGSFLNAVKTGNPYEMGVAMMSDENGNPLKNNGFSRRKLIALNAIGNKQFTFNEAQERELDIRRRQPGFFEETQMRARRLANDWYAPREEILKEASNPMGWLKSNPNMQDLEAKNPSKEEQEPGVITKLTNGVKKLFTNSKEQESANVAERGQDINMQ